ncbi:anaerobic ribonucleoside-triphosphate reductase activating protein [Actinotignum urinale]|uniref:Anaerobic ribonucleoside-triphosphate reductase activating protein n=1 Tax=Actinotignum urinale TaxID=190146 RepID=A0AAW9HYM9_9ACTO|nr:anaerobic ribonucleoside-triphosphate reductase activating protein [Actinotignum urinale]MDY5133530.1 anaerobic ribonucleoside-triphosphate reductase activating protein [Actinotignum urinale]MDY5155532.1 anaerobic ribonucleoside-triphosphate reductase activating protein [Actinotignum urinale]MDY5160961.1 anaerobic ribonucleoside-triphosphate reductase activating protein [Actinotignum urinale]WIK59355.1 anaerobic ribonucleoside-triphosphate reductase activating protein [Actinotignum urinale]
MKQINMLNSGAVASPRSRPAVYTRQNSVTMPAGVWKNIPDSWIMPDTWDEKPDISTPCGEGADGVVVPKKAQTLGVRQPRKPGAWDGRKLSQMYVADYKPFVMVDGEGVRCSIYVSGCPFHCPGCYNVASQNFRYGEPYTEELQERILKDCANSYVHGLSLVGGEPFLNTPVLLPLVRAFREKFGNTRTIWSWTGYTWEQLMAETPDKRMLLANIDVLVDGPFIQEQFYHDLAFRGSRNQRIIDVPASIEAGEVRLWKNGDYA